MLSYLLRLQIAAALPGLLGVCLATIYFVAVDEWATVRVLIFVGVVGLGLYALAKTWLHAIEDRDQREWQREDPGR